MSDHTVTRDGNPRFSRRTFIEGLGVGAAAGLAAPPLNAASAGSSQVTTLRGADVALRVAAAPVNFTGKQSFATVVNDSLPAPLLRWREGDTVTVRVTNELAEPTSIHWHGLVLPANMDGVPGLSFHGIAPGETFTYRFPLRQSGTYWYHAHSGFQEQTGLYGAIVIEPREPAPFAYDREHVVLFSDWTDRDPMALYLKLKRQSDYFNYQKRTIGDYVRDARRDGLAATRVAQSEWARMRMQPSDLADVSGATYTYLTNGHTPAGNWTGVFTPGERVRLRFISGSSMSTFDVRIPGLAMTVVAVDGQYVHPVTVDEIRMAAAETYDVLVTPAGADAFTIFAQSLDRSGYARGTLAVRDGLEAPYSEARPHRVPRHGRHGPQHDRHAEHACDARHGHARRSADASAERAAQSRHRHAGRGADAAARRSRRGTARQRPTRADLRESALTVRGPRRPRARAHARAAPDGPHGALHVVVRRRPVRQRRADCACATANACASSSSTTR